MTNSITAEIPQRSSKLPLLTKLQPFTIYRYHWLIALIVYSIVTIVVTYPLIFNLNTSIIGNNSGGDNLQNIWDLWWFKQAVEDGHNPNYTNYLFGQLPKVQIFVWTFTNAIAAWPLQYILSYLGVYNLLVLLSFALGGFFMYMLAGLFLENKIACFVAGFLFTFSCYHFSRSYGHLGLLTIEFLPFCAWCVFLFYRKPSIKSAVLAGVGIALVPLTDAYFLAYFTVPFALIFVAGILVADFRWFKVRQHLILGVLAGGIALILSAPMLISFILVDPSVQATAKDLADKTTESLSADLIAYLLPHPINPTFGHLTAPLFKNVQGIFGVEKNTFLGFSTIFLVLGTFWFRANRQKITLFWLLFALATMILSFGPKLFIGGQFIVDLPFYKILYGWSPMSTFRAPARMAPVPLMAFALLAGFTVNAILQRSFATKLKWKAILYTGFTGLLVLQVADSLPGPFPFLSEPIPPTPALYSQIAQDKEDGLVLDLPPFYHIGGFMYAQIFHGKKLVTGYPPRTTPEMYNSVANIPYIRPFLDFTQIKNAPLTPTDVFLNTDYKESFKDSLRLRHVTYVILHQFPEITAENYKWMVTFLTQNLGQPFYNNSTEKLMAWHISSTLPARDMQVRAGSGWLGETYIRNGKPVRAVSQNGQIIVDAASARTENLTFLTNSYFQPLTMNIFVNGELKNTTEIKRPGIIQEVKVNGLKLNAGKNVIEIHAAQGCSLPAKFDPKNLDTRCFSFDVQDVLFTQT